MNDLVESVQAKLCHCSVHRLDQVQQLSVPRTHLHPQKCPARGKQTDRDTERAVKPRRSDAQGIKTDT